MDTEQLNMQTTTTFYLDMQTTTTFYLEMQTSTTFYLDMQTTITFYLDRHCFIGIRQQRAELVRGKLKGFGPVLLLRMACFSFHLGALHSVPLASSVYVYFV
ncbi:hypothetical protein F444_10390 [Phytophthora nicotianae P1976]|uniref:Uncharacterized protein n=1 Tax=Phytophthora nicotianae P1976 TaxID=1317066 RepID=A0A081A472_PHYNI|nr:hypothetical protein F444_10390 [Phytophthora nicotianae P1976]